jgi:DNA-binding Lrp family transcriptional regulator
MLETDYLIIGSGAVGMAFADTLLSETDANIIIVDRFSKPGGHWNVAYPFVTLHQPSQFYGVNSKELSNGHIDEVGLNKGLLSLATGAEVSTYYEEVMQEVFLPSGRVQYFPSCNYVGNHEFESESTGEKYKVTVRKKLVDCTYLKTSVPATHTPNFKVAKGVTFIPLNELPTSNTAASEYTIIGGGKTGIDACLWLLENNVSPDKITWIVSRDAWLINRKNIQPTEAFFKTTFSALARQVKAIAKATSVENIFDGLEEAGVLLRIDKTIRPSMFHGATVSPLELQELQKITKIVRLGRVQQIEKNRIVLDEGVIETTTNHIHVDCSASAISNTAIKTVFEGDVITPQTVRSYQPVFSASLIAYVEANYEDEATKNKLCQVVPLPNHDTDWIRMTEAQMVNQFIWSQDKALREWTKNNRLDGFSRLAANVDKSNTDKVAILKTLRTYSMPAMLKLQQFQKALDTNGQAPIKNPQLQVNRDVFLKNRIVETADSALVVEKGAVLLAVETFAYSANNITYAVAGDTLGYWKFFPPTGENTDRWGVIPVWGFANVVASKAEGIPIGDRLFGYFPPAKFVKMTPVAITERRFIDGTAHRSKLPQGYNLYQRVLNEKSYNPAFDRERMLLFPLLITAFCLWDALKEANWYGAKQIIILSASSKTSCGLGYALQADEESPTVIGITADRNLAKVKSLDIYDQSIPYDQVTSVAANIPTVIVDMSGNTKILAALHTRLGDNMKFTINVGLTHWTNAKPQQGILRERSTFFFAPGHIQKRLKDWGPDGFEQKTTAFLATTAAKTRTWLKFKQINGLGELEAIHPAVCQGAIPPDEGLIVVL